MTKIKNFYDAHQALRKFYGPTGKDGPYTLDRIRALLDYLGNPHEKLRVIHVAGTSGKTSTAYYVSALLTATGAKVGLTVSPHVDEVNERVQINNVPLDETLFCRALGKFIELVEASGIRPSYFELMVAFAYYEFAEQRVDYAVVEVGLGGMLDGTNVCTRADKVCVITTIGLDHTEVLGDTLGLIAAQKAGIIHRSNHVFTYNQTPEIMNEITKRCTEYEATLHTLSSTTPPVSAAANLPLFQQHNFQLAKQTVDYILLRDRGSRLSSSEIIQGANAHIPARMEIFHIRGKTVIIDGSHNGQKLQALTESINAKFPDQKLATLVAFVSGPDTRWQPGIDALRTIAESIIITTFNAEQDVPKHSMDPKVVADYCKSKSFPGVEIEQDPTQAFKKLLQKSEPILLVAGSFYLLNDIRPLVLIKNKTRKA